LCVISQTCHLTDKFAEIHPNTVRISFKNKVWKNGEWNHKFALSQKLKHKFAFFLEAYQHINFSTLSEQGFLYQILSFFALTASGRVL